MKRIARCLVVIIVLTFALSTAAYAADNLDKFYSKVEKANEKIYTEIAKAQEKASTPDANLDKIIEKLLNETESIVEKLEEEAEELGIEIERVYIPVMIGDREVLVDPCYVPGL